MNLTDVMKYGNLEVLRAVDGLPHEEWEKPFLGGNWSVKDVVAHMASFETLLVDVLREFQGMEGTPVLDRFRSMDHGEFNLKEVAMRQGKSATEVLEEYRKAHEQAMALAAGISDEEYRQPGRLPWYGMEYALDDFIAYTYYGHKREHSAHIGMYRDMLDSQSR